MNFSTCRCISDVLMRSSEPQVLLFHHLPLEPYYPSYLPFLGFLFVTVNFLLFLAGLHGLQDLTSQTRDQTLPGSESAES